MKNFFVACLGFVLLSAFTGAVKKVPSVDIKTIEGKSVNILDYVGKGKPVIISFWASYCSPCKRELDAVSELYPQWQKEYNVELVAVTIDDARGLAKVPGIVSSKGWSYTVLSDLSLSLQNALSVQSIPETVLVDGDGNIVYTHSGYSSGDEFELEEKLKALKK
jgi:cytochrome c biogenesis protein CcmG, thiol:disulfide interchange protein DsbE